MFILIFLIFSLFILSFVLMIVSLVISKKSNNWRQKFTPFECGYDFFSYSRSPFSIRFFLIAIIFIIFDVEIALILPLIPVIFKSSIFFWMTSSYMFFLILIMGVLLEWKENSFEWKI
nr:NADH dehydrogenase subunit 3 [Aptinothrips stylifer]